MTAPTTRPLVADSVLELIGATPLVKLRRVIPQEVATVLGKMENLNPGGSVKDRIALAMVEDAERAGRLQPGSTIVEPTSGTPASASRSSPPSRAIAHLDHARGHVRRTPPPPRTLRAELVLTPDRA